MTYSDHTGGAFRIATLAASLLLAACGSEDAGADSGSTGSTGGESSGSGGSSGAAATGGAAGSGAGGAAGGAQSGPCGSGPTEPASLEEFILGPQVPVGAHPWPWFDETQVAGAELWAQAYLQNKSGGSDYYDLAHVLYQLHARSGDPKHLQLAHDVALEGWLRMPDSSAWPSKPSAFAIAPRSAPIAGLVLLALSDDTVPALTFYNKSDPSFSETWTLWDWLAQFARRQYPSWLGLRLDNDGLWAGIRDGGMLLHYIAILAKAHPEQAVREEMRQMALDAAKKYYARLQWPDGSWRWNPGDHVDATQPFMTGLLLEALIAVHQLTGDEDVAQAIVKGTEAVYRDMYDQNPVPFDLLPGVKVRAVHYIVYGDKCQPIIGPQAGCGNNFDDSGGSGTAHNKLRVVRLRNSLVVHAFGYAARLTQDEKFCSWGDDLFSATYGDDVGPGADGHVGLAESNKGKEYIQSFRSAGRYLGWR
jgi:hypothetical protein